MSDVVSNSFIREIVRANRHQVELDLRHTSGESFKLIITADNAVALARHWEEVKQFLATLAGEEPLGSTLCKED